MNSLNFDSSPETNQNQPATTLLKVPRLDSLQHRLQHARDADGQPIPLLDELLFFLDDPPPGTAARWQEGADLCESHGIKTSRMSVWRFYRAHILQWRREQNPAPLKWNSIEMSSFYHLIPSHNGISPCPPPGRNSIERSSPYDLIPSHTTS